MSKTNKGLEELRAWCVKERDDNAKAIAKYESGERKIQVRTNDGPWQDVTADQLEDSKRVVAEMDRVIAEIDAQIATQ